jgi:hypothetical protein
MTYPASHKELTSAIKHLDAESVKKALVTLLESRTPGRDVYDFTFRLSELALISQLAAQELKRKELQKAKPCDSNPNWNAKFDKRHEGKYCYVINGKPVLWSADLYDLNHKIDKRYAFRCAGFVILYANGSQTYVGR